MDFVFPQLFVSQKLGFMFLVWTTDMCPILLFSVLVSEFLFVPGDNAGIWMLQIWV
jgi:hypothetical protein